MSKPFLLQVCNCQETGHDTGSIWDAVDPATLGGTVSGATRTLSHGIVPAYASDGNIVAATLPGSPLPTGSSGALTSPQFLLPSSINNYNAYTFQHWHHLDAMDGAWVEYKLDNGQWTYIEPIGGYPSTISANALYPMVLMELHLESLEMVITVDGQMHCLLSII